MDIVFILMRLVEFIQIMANTSSLNRTQCVQNTEWKPTNKVLSHLQVVNYITQLVWGIIQKSPFGDLCYVDQFGENVNRIVEVCTQVGSKQHWLNRDPGLVELVGEGDHNQFSTTFWLHGGSTTESGLAFSSLLVYHLKRFAFQIGGQRTRTDD